MESTSEFHCYIEDPTVWRCLSIRLCNVVLVSLDYNPKLICQSLALWTVDKQTWWQSHKWKIFRPPEFWGGLFDCCRYWHLFQIITGHVNIQFMTNTDQLKRRMLQTYRTKVFSSVDKIKIQCLSTSNPILEVPFWALNYTPCRMKHLKCPKSSECELIPLWKIFHLSLSCDFWKLPVTKYRTWHIPFYAD